MAISQDAFTAISFLALCMEKNPEQKDKKDRNIETFKCKNGASLIGTLTDKYVLYMID
jgi:hypothetical protein